MQLGHQYVEQVFQFGTAVDSPSLYFVSVVDINQKLIKVGYQSYEVTVGELMDNYMEVTSCRGFLAYKPCFRIIQHGPFFGQIAIESRKLASYGFSTDSPCFKVYEDDEENLKIQLTAAINRHNNANDKDIIAIIVQIQNFETNFEVDLSKNLKYLKERLINNIQPLKKQIPNNLTLMKEGLFMTDQNAILRSYGIKSNMKIRVNIIKKSGCFSKDAQILSQQNKRISIKDLSVGEKIISYNLKSRQFESDTITFIHQSKVDQIIVIELFNRTKIQTTPNHLFLCADEVYRCVQGKRQNGQLLQKGCKLKLYNGTAQIQSIQHKTLPNPQIFYHLCIENNHNFIVNEAIVHNLFINVIIQNDVTQKVSIQPNQPFLKIKEDLEQIYQIQINNQRLFFAGKQIKNHETMTDRNIPKEANIYFKFRPSEEFNFLHPLAPILTYSGQMRPISQIKQGQGVVSWDSLTNSASGLGDIVVDIRTRQVKQIVIIKLDTYEKQIVLSMDTYLQLENGQAMNVRDICYHFEHDKWPLLRKIDGKTYRIRQIAHEVLQKPVKYYKLILSSGQNYVANELIVYNLVINVIVMKDKKRINRLIFGANSTDKIKYLKSRISARTGFPENSIQLTFNNNRLDDEAEIAGCDIKTQNIVTANSLLKVSKSSLYMSKLKQPKKGNLQLYLQLSQNEKIQLDFNQSKDKTVEQIMREVLPSYESSYFFLFAQLIIYPHERLSKIQQSSQFGDNTIIVVKNEKLAFVQNMSIQATQVKNENFIYSPASRTQEFGNSRIQVFRQKDLNNMFAAASSRISSDKKIDSSYLKRQKFYLPFLYYTSKKYSDEIFRYIKRFDKYKNQLRDNTSVYSIIKDLYINMNLLPNYLGSCFFGMKNFRFSKFYRKQHTFYWHNFVIAYKEEQKVVKDLNNNNGTIFIVSSLNGKQIERFSVDPSRQEILFAPFTYFMVERIQKEAGFDRVWLSEISSPITFQKNIVLWVDDEPSNNLRVIRQILKEKDIQILQVTSTILAQKWVKEFGWLLNWKGLRFKLISDMKRIENGVLNNQAGVDLLERLYKVHGISAQILIFCGKKQTAENIILARNIPKEKYFSITMLESEVVKFCNFKKA